MFIRGENMTEKKVKKEAEEVSEKVEEVSKEVAKKAEESVKEIKETAEEASEEIEKTGKKVAREIKRAGEETEEFEVEGDAPVVGKTVEEIDDLGLLGEDALLVEVERGDKNITPKGDTIIKVGDIVTVTSSSGISDKTRMAFSKKLDE